MHNKNRRQLDIDAVDLIPARSCGRKKERLVVMRLITATGRYDVPMRASQAAALGAALSETA
jgi:hypothetical protein